MDLLSLQLLFMGLIFISTTFIGSAPMLFGNYFKRKLSLSSETTDRLISDASCFGAGVFLYVCFLGLLPDADQKFHSIFEDLERSNRFSHTFVDFPWGFFTVTIGFLVIFSIDKFVHALHESRKTKSKALRVGSISTPLTAVTPTTDVLVEREQKVPSKEILSYDCHVQVCGIAEDSNGHGVPTSLMFLFALGIHSVFEGIAVGLQDSRVKITEYAIAILLHEIVMAFTFGLEVTKSKSLSRKTKFLYIFMFTSSIPVGMGIGLGLQNSNSNHQELISAIIEAFATGIFIHVIFIEILGNEFSHKHSQSHKCLLIVAAAAAPEEPSPETNIKESSEIIRILEKISCICLGFTFLILMNVFMVKHSH